MLIRYKTYIFILTFALVKSDCLSLKNIADKIVENNRLNKIDKSDLLRILNSNFNYSFTNRSYKSELLNTAYTLIQHSPDNLLIFAREDETVGPCKKDVTELLELSYYYTKRFLEEHHIIPEDIFEFYSYIHCTHYQYNKYNIADLLAVNTNEDESTEDE